MRRNEKEIINIDEKLELINKCKHCRLGLSLNNNPYIVPLNYGFLYEDDKLTLYFHSAKEGRKIDIIRSNNNACFEIDSNTNLVTSDNLCRFGYEFKSIIGFGKIFFLETLQEKISGLGIFMKHQTGSNTEYSFTENELNNVAVYKLVVDEFTGKSSPVKK